LLRDVYGAGRAAGLGGPAAGRLTAGILCLLAAMMVQAPAAWAHDELLKSAPGSGAVLQEVPDAVVLSFSDEPAELGAEIQVLDAEGRNHADGPLQISGRTARQVLDRAARPGEYTVSWRVASGDAHPVEGTFAFTVDTADAAEVPAGEGNDAVAGTPEPLETVEPAAKDGGAFQGAVPWSIAGMIAVLAVLAVVLAVGSRRRSRPAPGADESDAG
jgi:methionine-rich copper-binding protein CopC